MFLTQHRTTRPSTSATGADPQSRSAGTQPGPVIGTPRDPRDVRAEEALGDRLRLEAQNAVKTATGALKDALQEHFFNLPSAERPTNNEVITRIADFVRIAEQRLEARHAALYLANADWDLDLAFRRYMEERYSPTGSPHLSEPLSEAPTNLSADAGRPSERVARSSSPESDKDTEVRSSLTIGLANFLMTIG